MYAKALLSTDGSENSERAARKVIALAKEGAISNVVVFYSVMHRGFANMMAQQVPEVDYYSLVIDSMEKEGQQLLDATREMFEVENIAVEVRLVKEVSPEDYIASIVPEEGFDLVVLGYSGHHSRLREAFMGSVPTRVLNAAKCDVLVVR